MRRHRLDGFPGGWFVGNFEPRILKGSDVEVATKTYGAGDREDRHVHRIAVELTLVASGRVRMNGEELGPGDIAEIPAGEPADFLALEDAITVVVKSPSIPGDKYSA